MKGFLIGAPLRNNSLGLSSHFPLKNFGFNTEYTSLKNLEFPNYYLLRVGTKQ